MADRNQIYRDMAPYINYDISAWGDMLEQFPAEKVKKGTVIYMQHSRGHNVVLVEKGVATMSFINTEGVERIHFFGSSGYVFGFRHCMSGKPYGGRQDQLKEVTLSKSSAAVVVPFLLQPVISLILVSVLNQGNGAMVAVMLI